MWGTNTNHIYEICFLYYRQLFKQQRKVKLRVNDHYTTADARPGLLGDPQERPPVAAVARLSLEGNPGQAGRLTDR